MLHMVEERVSCSCCSFLDVPFLQLFENAFEFIPFFFIHFIQQTVETQNAIVKRVSLQRVHSPQLLCVQVVGLVLLQVGHVLQQQKECKVKCN